MRLSSYQSKVYANQKGQETVKVFVSRAEREGTPSLGRNWRRLVFFFELISKFFPWIFDWCKQNYTSTELKRLEKG